MGVPLQPVLELNPHLVPNAHKLLSGQPEQSQHLVNLLPLGLHAGGHCGHHGGPLGAATLRQEEADVTVRDQFPHHLVQAFWVSGGGGGMAKYVKIIKARAQPIGTDTGVAEEWAPGEPCWAKAHPFSCWMEGEDGGD